jgi:peptidoglycan/xylan/chitin deacetylase (PgdA/CDA1 family)
MVGLLQRANNLITRSLPLKWIRSHADRPMASITFDDFPKSAWTVAGPILARYGAKATYYTAGGFCGVTEDGLEYYDTEDLLAVRAAGHEVGCHSFSHDMAPTLRTEALLADLDRNALFMTTELGEQDLCSYAYPYGQISPRTKAVMGQRYSSARGVRSGVNAKTLDLAELKAIPIEYRRWIPEEIDAAIAQAQALSGWVIFFTHDVSDAPSPFGCTPAMLDHVLARLAAAQVDILPVKHALARAVFGHDA